LARDHAQELSLRVRVLRVQPAQRIALRVRVVVLDEHRVDPARAILLGRERLEEEAAVVAVHLGLDQHDARNRGLYEARAHSSSPRADGLTPRAISSTRLS